MRPIEYDPIIDQYFTDIDGDEVRCDSAYRLEDILHRLDERETRQEDARGTWVVIMLAAVLLAVAAWLARYF
jgi:fatty acid desaturase